MKISKSIFIFMLAIFSINTASASLVIAFDLGDEKENKDFLQKLSELRKYLKKGRALEKHETTEKVGAIGRKKEVLRGTNMLVKDKRIMGLNNLIARLMKIKKKAKTKKEATKKFQIKDVKRPHITLLVIREDQQREIMKHLKKKGFEKPKNLSKWKELKKELITRIDNAIKKATKKKNTNYKIFIKNKAKVFGRPQKENGKRKHFYVGQKTEIDHTQKDDFKNLLNDIRDELKKNKIDYKKWYSKIGHGHISEIEIHPTGKNNLYQVSKMLREEMLGASKKTKSFLDSAKLSPPKKGIHGRIMLMETDKGTVKKVIARF